MLRGVNWIQNSIVPAPMRIADLSFGGYTLSEVLRTAAALGIADKLAQGTMTAEALAEEIGRYTCCRKHQSKVPLCMVPWRSTPDTCMHQRTKEPNALIAAQHRACVKECICLSLEGQTLVHTLRAQQACKCTE